MNTLATTLINSNRFTISMFLLSTISTCYIHNSIPSPRSEKNPCCVFALTSKSWHNYAQNKEKLDRKRIKNNWKILQQGKAEKHLQKKATKQKLNSEKPETEQYEIAKKSSKGRKKRNKNGCTQKQLRLKQQPENYFI